VAKVSEPAGGNSLTARGAALLCAGSMLAFGFWAYFEPHSFAHFINYAPYNRHLIHDAGAFQIGIGVTTALASFCGDALLVALIGFAVASGIHTVSHYLDRNIGGHDSDVPELAIFPIIALFGIYLQWGVRRSRR